MHRQRGAYTAMTAVLGIGLLAGCSGGDSSGRTVDTADAAGAARGDGANSHPKSSPGVIVPGKPGEPARTLSGKALDDLVQQPRTTANEADEQFVRMMIPHHHQALLMTKLAPERAASEKVRGLAARINDAQRAEITAMQAWQENHDVAVTDPRTSYHMLEDHTEHLHMMGMATPQQLDALRAAKGRRFDELFLRLMTDHHAGAVSMAEDVAADGHAVLLHQMALDIMATQRDEIRIMRTWLNRME